MSSGAEPSGETDFTKDPYPRWNVPHLLTVCVHGPDSKEKNVSAFPTQHCHSLLPFIRISVPPKPTSVVVFHSSLSSTFLCGRGQGLYHVLSPSSSFLKQWWGLPMWVTSWRADEANILFPGREAMFEKRERECHQWEQPFWAMNTGKNWAKKAGICTRLWNISGLWQSLSWQKCPLLITQPSTIILFLPWFHFQTLLVLNLWPSRIQPTV